MPILSLFGILFFDVEKFIDYWVFTPVPKNMLHKFWKTYPGKQFLSNFDGPWIHQNTNSMHLRKRNPVDTTKQGTKPSSRIVVNPSTFELTVDGVEKLLKTNIFPFCPFVKEVAKRRYESPTQKRISSSSLNRPVSIWSWCHAAASTACWHQYAAAAVSFLFGTPSTNTQCWQCHISPSGSNCSRWSGERCSAGGACRLAFFLARICCGWQFDCQLYILRQTWRKKHKTYATGIGL